MKIRNFFFVLTLALLGFAVVAAGGGFFAFKYLSSEDSSDAKIFTKEGIMQILSMESTVYYADGKTKLGTFFEGSHRDYVPFDSIPPRIPEALVAAEDHNFFQHGGVDYKAIAYAMLDNVKSGSLHRGGSTLTQQTAKILFNRKGRTIGGKFKELFNAFKLEKHFTKKEILEFYLNQFYVSGNGHGVRIAARYFFNKELADLNLLECAFIAGSVKGPNQYNPFIQETPAKKQKALEKAQYRVAYVLKQLAKDKKITAAEYAAASKQKLEFKKGSFQFSLSTNMVQVKHILETPRLQKILEQNDVQDYMSDGLQIFSTLDADLQKAAEYATNHNLSRLEILLKGYIPPKEKVPNLVSRFQAGNFYIGRVNSIRYDKKTPTSLELEFGSSKGIIGSEALNEFLQNWNMHEQGSAALPTAAVRADIIKKLFSPGSLVYCSVPYQYFKGDIPDTLQNSLRIEMKPVIQGGLQVLQEGKVLANVGGFENTGYDRVNQAKRQFGSAFKPLVFAAALEQGWSPLDALANFRQLFRIGSLFYFPKPDHAPEDTVSMAWAGRRSENLASIYLLAHLFDKSKFAGFWETARKVGGSPENFSMQNEFEIFVRDSLGLILDEEHLREIAYQKEIGDIAIDLTFEGKVGEAEALRNLPYGWGFNHEAEKYASSEDKEARLRYRILSKNYSNYLRKAHAWVNRDSSHYKPIIARQVASSNIGFFEKTPDSNWTLANTSEAWLQSDSLLVEGQVSLATLKKVEAKVRAKIQNNDGSPYTKENLFASSDFRALLALRYVVYFSHQLGIASRLDPVISFPLGTNVINLAEAVNAYQALKDGYVYKSKTGENQMFIQKICLRDGTVIWEDELQRDKVISDKTRYGLEAILGSVVKGGTGQQIYKELKVFGGGKNGAGNLELSIPAYGKTGTTNDYKNGAFLGFVAAPRGPGKGFDSQAGFSIGTYVGFDDNRVMLHKGFKGTGAGVAIPAWLATAKALVQVQDFASRIDFLDLEAQATGAAPLFQMEKYSKYTVSKRTGLPLLNKDENFLKSTLGNYTEDISDEISGNENMTGDVIPYTQLLMREE